MTLDAVLTLSILLAAVLLFATEALRVDVVAMLVLVSLLVLGLVTPAQALSGFSSQATVAVAAMFVLSAGLTRTGALRLVGQQFARIRQTWAFTLAVMVSLGAMSAFVNNTAAVAVFLPMVLAVAAARRFSPSRVLIPLSYAAQMGGVCTLIGTSTNLLVHALAQDLGLPGFSLFEFAPLGLITMAAGMAYLLLVGPWLLPDRGAQELTHQYELGKYITELRVPAGSPLLGQTVAQARLGELHNVYVLELLRGDAKVWAPRAQHLQAGDVLLVRGDWQRVTTLMEQARLELAPDFALNDAQFNDDQQVLAEVMIAPGSRFVGQTPAQIDARWRDGASVLAIHRRGQLLREQLRGVVLSVGDILLVHVPASRIAQLRANPNLVVLTEKEGEGGGRRRGWLALAIMVGVVGLASLEFLPIVAAALAGCLAMVLTRCLTPDEAYDAIDWRIVVLLAGVIPMGLALQGSGAAGALAALVMNGVGTLGPLAVLAAIYLLTAVLTEFMSNNATAVLMTPIAVASAHTVGADPTPFVVAVAFAASTAFATPVGYQTNTMVYNAGGYRFMDFVRIGVPLNLLFWAIAVVCIPVFWPL